MKVVFGVLSVCFMFALLTSACTGTFTDSRAKREMRETLVLCAEDRDDDSKVAFEKVLEEIRKNNGLPEATACADPASATADNVYTPPPGSWLQSDMKVYAACLILHNKKPAAEDAYKKLTAISKIDADFYSDLAKLYYESGDYTHAMHYYQKEADRKGHYGRIEALERVIDCASQIKDHGKAISLAQQSYEWVKTTYNPPGAQSGLYYRALVSLADAYVEAGLVSDTSKTLEQINSLTLQDYQRDAHADLVSAKLTLLTGNAAAADSFYRKAAEMAEKQSAFWSDGVVQCMKEQAHFLLSQGRQSEANRLIATTKALENIDTGLLFLESQTLPKHLRLKLGRPLLESGAQVLQNAPQAWQAPYVRKMLDRYK